MGLRGLIARARTEGNLEAAIDLANRADELKPGTPWVVKELFDLHLKLRHWDEAETVLARMARGKAAKSASVKRTRSVIALERARQALKRDEKAAAFDLALSAHQLDPAFVPASVLAIRLSVPSRKRDKLIAEAWKTNPHPDLIAAIREAKAFEDEAAWLDYVRTMLAPNTPDNRETLMEEARAALAAQKWGEARKYLNRVAEIDPS
ncbi:tetratricopeptide repeat protein, partial [Brevundimonas denitrificans]